MKTVYDTKFYDSIAPLSLASAEIIVPLVVSLVSPQRLVDIGCGTGTWLSVFKRHGVQTVLGIDGGHVPQAQLVISEAEFSPQDLCRPLNVTARFDLAICLEVAEHLPRRYAPVLVQSLTELSPVVLFSAAFPGQGGIHHVNERWAHYWENLFARHDYRAADPIRPLVWQHARVAWWYRANLLMYFHKDILFKNDLFAEMVDQYSSNPLTLTHKDTLKYYNSLGYRMRGSIESCKQFVKRFLPHHRPATRK